MPAAPPEPIDGRRTATEPTAGAPPTPPAATHRHRVPDPTPHVHTRHDRTTPLPHECRTNQCRPSQSTGDAPRRSPPPTIRRAPPPTPPAATHRHRAPDATPTSRHDRITPASVHTLGHPTAEPMHRCTRLHPSLHPAPAQHPCAGARPRCLARPSPACSARLGRAPWFASFKNSRESVSQTFCRVLGDTPQALTRSSLCSNI